MTSISCEGYQLISRAIMVGATGRLAEEEARLLRLRQEAEGPVRDELQRARSELEVRICCSLGLPARQLC